MKLTDNFYLSEFTRSNTAKAHGIDNTPTPAQVANLKRLCERVMQPIRDKFGRLDVSSGFRSKRVNRHRSIKGARNSQHETGSAADFRIEGMTVQEAFEAIINSGIEYDQIIQEFDRWVHISYSDNPRQQALVATKDANDKTVYTNYKSIKK
ncbi:MAG: D-Ala-D-Ala carboxypeptidase family metallohydrolase [Shewanella sp.]